MSRPSTLTPAWSPWGSIQESEELGEDGILLVRTATSKGYFIPGQANDKVYPAWRVRTGWYGQGERDGHWAIVVITFPELFPRRTVEAAHALQRQARPSEYRTAVAEGQIQAENPGADVVADLPAAVEQALTSVTAAPQLPTRRLPQLAPASAPSTGPAKLATASAAVAVRRTPIGPRKAGRIATQVWGEWHDSVPTGFVGVQAAPDADPNDLTWHLIPVGEYNTRPGFRFTVDPERHRAWPEHP
ncbi:DUF7007 domain-containing protein [Kineosporia babensis]|uniref:DUF7007 domain-containing protein n=1 Tax=Kineosporia babensis TaxID=499548 RepID=A0A9X1NLI1_9ACTN|nr:hypothetical protein [Kineosporia babensis]MCD5316530.1 hypothetical protein [Kineosporia babensis]